jgi:hypothetical protein
MHQELRRLVAPAREVHHNRLPNPSHALNPRSPQRLDDLRLARFERLRLAAGPHALDALPAHPRIHTLRNGLDFRQFWHQPLGYAGQP